MRRKVIGTTLVALMAVAVGHRLWAWHGVEHARTVDVALRILPEDVPAFFRQGSRYIAHTAIDPDLVKIESLKQLNDTEFPEHFIDLEYLQGEPLPPTRQEFRKLCAQLQVDPEKVGYLPYAVVEWTQRLAVAFAEYRRWPDDPVIQYKAMVYAGILSHYAADATQPLHTTIHYDGRRNDDGTSPRTGIHHKVDGLLRKLRYIPGHSEDHLIVTTYNEDLFASIVAQITIAHGRVERLYELEQEIPEWEAKRIESEQVRELARECFDHAATFTASIFYTAWIMSENIEIPGWLVR